MARAKKPTTKPSQKRSVDPELENMVFNLQSSLENDGFGWKKDGSGFFRDMFLKDKQFEHLIEFFRIRPLKSDLGSLYRLRPRSQKRKSRQRGG